MCPCVLSTKRRRCNEMPVHRREGEPLLSAARESWGSSRDPAPRKLALWCPGVPVPTAAVSSLPLGALGKIKMVLGTSLVAHMVKSLPAVQET